MKITLVCRNGRWQYQSTEVGQGVHLRALSNFPCLLVGEWTYLLSTTMPPIIALLIIYDRDQLSSQEHKLCVPQSSGAPDANPLSVRALKSRGHISKKDFESTLHHYCPSVELVSQKDGPLGRTRLMPHSSSIVAFRD